MYLSKLEIFGFKSFARKETIRFDEGLTSIIGPNGCGKSNIVDAIRWVLGEQRPSVLRCDRMENLIFNGSDKRKPLSVSEVSMVIENNKQILPSEYTEIKITRRLYRSGESDYLINNQQVRLMDIINLFIDTGMGADAYSVIELKMVEQILSDNAEERRRLFEEAAGIKKYKQRRKSALRKLDTTRRELLRLEDIISEVQKTVNSLSRQVGKARRYHEYKDQLREKDLLVTRLRIRTHESDLQPLELEFEQVNASKETLSKEIHTREADIEKLHTHAVDMEHAYRKISAELQKADENILEFQKDKQLRQQKIDSLRERINSYKREIEEQRQRIQQMAMEKEILSGQIEAAGQKAATLQEEYRKSVAAKEQAETNYRLVRREYQEFVKANMEQLQQSSTDKEAFQKVRLEKENVENALANGTAQLDRLQERLNVKEAELGALRRQAEEARNRQKTLQQETGELKEQIEALQEKQDDIRSRIIRGEGQLEKVRNRRDFLENLIESYEGFSASVQFVMSRKSEFEGLVDTLANLVDSEEKYRFALESYLSEISTYLIVKKVDTARKILEQIQNRQKGRLHLIPLQLLNTNHSVNHYPLPEKNGEVLPIKEIASYDSVYEDLFNFLLDRVYLVPDLDTALKMREEFPHITYVTLEGEILRDWGNLTGGVSDNGQSLIGRQQQFEKASREFEELKEEMGSLRTALDKSTIELNRHGETLKQKHSRLKTTEQELTGLDTKVNNLQFEVSHLRNTFDEIRAEIENLQNKLKNLAEQESRLMPQIRQQDETLHTYHLRESEIGEKQKENEERLRDFQEAAQKLQIELLQQTNLEKELQQKLLFIHQNREEAGRFISQREENIRECEREIVSLVTENRGGEEQLESAYRERDEIEKQRNEVEKKLQELQSAVQNAEMELKKKQRQWNEARDRLQQLELQIQELRVKKSTLEEQLVENYGDQALQYDPADLDPALTIGEAQEEIELLRSKLEGLGDVNPLAIKEHRKEKERLDFLKQQRADLNSAEDQLVETIHKLNTTARKEFMDTFQKVQANFRKVFKEFFENGEADLVLVESRDPLEANIDIKIHMKGKQLNTLSLLSAGEKTLTAISMLFAIYLVKPSPFCILDEVDAPLDDVNISRFTHALQQFSKDTQFILVTHNKRTIEATQSLYGITMEEPGVSKVVSVRLD